MRYKIHSQQDEDYASYEDIAKAMGFKSLQSARWQVNKALRKLRKAMAVNRDQWRELYEPEPEPCYGRGESAGAKWKVSELRPVELNPGRKL